MDKTTSDNFGDTEKVKTTFDTLQSTERRGKISTVQDVLLIWLDDKIDNSRTDCHDTIVQLGRVVNNIETFTDGEECIQFIENITTNKVCMIISASLGQHIVPRIHNMFQVDSIFIFADDKDHHIEWTKNWPKIKEIFTEISSICEALKQAVEQCEQNAITISFTPTTGDVSNENLNQLDTLFMYSQILKEILLTIDFKEKDIKNFTMYCRDVFAENENELKKIDEFEMEYHHKTPVWWYTHDRFLHSMVNRSLQSMNMNIIIKLGFFIRDLHRHIEQLHSEQFKGHHDNKIFTVYRGQGMLKTVFEQLRKLKGGLTSYNTFLTTSKDRKISLDLAQNAINNPDLVGVLFAMTIDPSISTIPFASITDISSNQDAKDEILFSMHTVFRISDIKPIDENNRLFQIDLRLTNDNDEGLCFLAEHIRQEIYSKNGWSQLSSLLSKMGQFEEAEQINKFSLEETTNQTDQVSTYHQLGYSKSNQGKYEEAIEYYKKALEIQQQSLPSNHPDLVTSYNNIGTVYSDMGEYEKALSYYEKVLQIHRQILPPNHPDLATTYGNIGMAQSNMGEREKALSSYEKAHEILEKSLPPMHPNLATSYNNIGTIYRDTDKFDKALSFYEKALQIHQQSLPPNHPDLAISHSNIGMAYSNIGEYSKALSSFEKSLEIQQQTLPSNHPNLAKIHGNIGMVYFDISEYSKALLSYQRAVDIAEQSLPPNHPDLQQWQKNLEDIKKKL